MGELFRGGAKVTLGVRSGCRTEDGKGKAGSKKVEARGTL